MAPTARKSLGRAAKAPVEAPDLSVYDFDCPGDKGSCPRAPLQQGGSALRAPGAAGAPPVGAGAALGRMETPWSWVGAAPRFQFPAPRRPCSPFPAPLGPCSPHFPLAPGAGRALPRTPLWPFTDACLKWPQALTCTQGIPPVCLSVGCSRNLSLA